MTTKSSLSNGKDDRSPFQMPSIPPLPMLDKENRGSSEVKNNLVASQKSSFYVDTKRSISRRNPSKKRILKSSIHSSQCNKGPSRILSQRIHRGSSKSAGGIAQQPIVTNGEENSILSPSVPQTFRPPPRRILRYKETLESLFCITRDSELEHIELSRKIADGPLSDDAAAWRRVLKLATNQLEKLKNSEENLSQFLGDDLIRLHHRATSRFSLENLQDEDQGDVLAIWLSYAKIQGKFKSADEARMIYHHIRNQRFGVSSARFYLELARFELQQNCLDKAKAALHFGIENKAEPINELTNALNKLENEIMKKNAMCQSAGEKVKETKRTPHDRLSPLSVVSDTIPPLYSRNTAIGLSPKKRKAEERGSPTRFGTLIGTSEVTNTTENKRIKQTEQIQEKGDKIAGSCSLTGINNRSLEGSSTRTKYLSRHIADSSLMQDDVDVIKMSPLPSVFPVNEASAAAKDISERSNRTPIIPTAKTPSTECRIDQFSATKMSKAKAAGKSVGKLGKSRRPKLTAKTPRLARAELGKPQRIIDPEQSMMFDNSETEEETEDVSRRPDSTKDSIELKPSKITKLDLAYMWDWDPKSHRNGKPNGDSTNAEKTLIMGRVDEEQSSCSSSSNSSAIMTGSSHSTSNSQASKSAHSTSSQHTQRSDETPGIGDDYNDGRRSHDNSEQNISVSPETALLIQKSNFDFLPLVSEDNILRVNRVPYVKLGVIGKGGSSKVYRALSKDYSVVGIKKVKLAGMDKKAIDGYANEIALLKRLRGNPAIIQMYDSEVDLERKAIFVTMELGEVDLNHVLQQQAMQHTLNMNFIRLTWQQMLSAVHSIHEERIIHGDLKPANFLFVRGALKLIDFGIAKAIQSDDTTNIYRESQIGTLNYMSPEAILDTGSGKNGARMKIGRASDIWSMGCILYQMVHGKTPFAELHMIRKLQAIVDPNHKICFPDTLDDAAVDAMKQCLRRKASERPPIVGKNGLLNEHRFLNSSRKLLDMKEQYHNTF